MFYKTYEDRLSKLKVITFVWFIFCFIVYAVQGSILRAIFGALMWTVPIFSIGLIIRILFVDKDEAPSQIEAQSNVVTEPSVETQSSVVTESIVEEESSVEAESGVDVDSSAVEESIAEEESSAEDESSEDSQ